MKTKNSMTNIKMDKELENLFNQTGKIAAPQDFTRTLMKKIVQEKATVYKPVISARAWVVIGLIVAVMLASAAVFPSATGSVSPVWEKITGFFHFSLLQQETGYFHAMGEKGHGTFVVLFSVLGVVVSWGWFYLFFQGKGLHRKNHSGGMAFL